MSDFWSKKDKEDYDRQAVKGNEFNRFYREYKKTLDTNTVYYIDFNNRSLIAKFEKKISPFDRYVLKWW